jgi:hypothetical protein
MSVVDLGPFGKYDSLPLGEEEVTDPANDMRLANWFIAGQVMPVAVEDNLGDIVVRGLVELREHPRLYALARVAAGTGRRHVPLRVLLTGPVETGALVFEVRTYGEGQGDFMFLVDAPEWLWQTDGWYSELGFKEKTT